MLKTSKTSGVDPPATGEKSAFFPSTKWPKIIEAGSPVEADRQSSLSFIAERYWRPVFYYVRSRGFDPDQAADMAQNFFVRSFEKGAFAKADPARGRFRSFLLTALKNFIANSVRDAHAGIRHPKEGFVPAHELRTDEGPYLVPIDRENPEAAFDRAWASELVLRVLKALEDEYNVPDKEAHLKLFRETIINPALHGVDAPSVKELATPLGLTEKQAHNRLLAARRAYQRLLREEIRSFAGSEEEVADEVQDLFKLLAKA